MSKTKQSIHALSILVLCGFGYACKTTSDYTNGSVKYALAPKVGAPKGRMSPGVVWTGQELLVWGGKSETLLGEGTGGGVYSPVRGTWRSISSADAPYARYQHSSVWTGTDLIVWGGLSARGGATFLGDGGVYNPEYNSWDDGLKSDVIKGRAGHSAVWTGKEMIVWGGFDDEHEFSDGAVYTPKTRTWKVLPKDGAPKARSQHFAAWTGSKMVVWGGKSEGKELRDGAIYDPASNTWSKMARSGDLIEAEMGMSIAWVDGYMVVWGGQVKGQAVDTGAIWNSATDTWSEMPIGGPAARTQHLAISTGKEMIVFGGKADIAFTDGAVFSPAEGKWTSRFRIRNKDFVITQRSQAAVWAQGQMLIWGVGKDADVLTPEVDGKKGTLNGVLAISVTQK